MDRKFIIMPALLLFSAFTHLTAPLSAAGRGEQIEPAVSAEPDQSFSFTDSRGMTVELDSPPRRIISLGPNVTETIYALGREELLIGRTDFCDYPEQVSEITSVGVLQDPNLERIVALNPDLVIASTHADPDVLKKLESYSIKTVLIYGEESFEGMEEVIKGCAGLLNAEKEGRTLLEDLRNRRTDIRDSVAVMKRSPSCYYALGFGEGGDWTSGGNTFISELLTLAGGRNIAEDQEGWSYSKELLVSRQPEIIFVNKGLKEEFLSLPVYRDLEAAVKGYVIEIDENILVRQGPRQIQALEEIHRIMEMVP